MSTRDQLHQAIDRLAENQLGQALVVVQNLLDADADPVKQRLKTMLGVQLPEQWPPKFGAFEPIQVEGEPVSEQLIRERR